MYLETFGFQANNPVNICTQELLSFCVLTVFTFCGCRWRRVVNEDLLYQHLLLLCQYDRFSYSNLSSTHQRIASAHNMQFS